MEKSVHVGSHTLNVAALYDPGKKVGPADDCGTVLSLKARLWTGSRAARDFVKSKHLADPDAPIETCPHLINGHDHSDHHSRSVEPAVSGLGDQVESLAHQLAVANALKADTEVQVSELQHLLDLAFTGISQLQARNQELDCVCTDHERLLKGYEERTRDSETMLHSAVSQVEQLTSENEKLANQKAALYSALSESLATSGRKQEVLEAQLHQLKANLAARDAEVSSVRMELRDACRVADDRVKAVHSTWEKKVKEVVNQRARLHLEASEHRHKVAYLEKQKLTAEEALTTCKADLRVMTSKLRTAQDDLKLANAQVQAAQKREQASERHITFLESIVPVEGKEAKRLTDLSDKLEKTMAKSKRTRLQDVTNRRGTVAPLKDLREDTPAPARPMGKGPLAMSGHVSSTGTKNALSLQDKRLGTTVYPATPRILEPDCSMVSDSSASFVKMHASNLDISEGELLFGSLGTPATTFDHTLAATEARARRSMAAVLNTTLRVATRRRL